MFNQTDHDANEFWKVLWHSAYLLNSRHPVSKSKATAFISPRSIWRIFLELNSWGLHPSSKSLCVFKSSLKPHQIRRFHLVALQWTSKKCTKNCAARARLFSLRRSCCRRRGCLTSLLGSLSSDVFERYTSTGSEPFSLLMCLDVSKFVVRSVCTL